MATKDWSANQYLKFNQERTRPSRDLIAQIPLQSPRRIIDLGCGPGNSTAALAQHFTNSHITGMDSSPDMIEKAKAALPDIDFTLSDLATYRPSEQVDLYFSNAVFHWLRSAQRLEAIASLIDSQPSGGVFAFQVPDNYTEPSHRLMREVAAREPWASVLSGHQPALDPVQSPQELYDLLSPRCQSLDIWHTHYQHVLESHEAIVEWVKGTGLRPFIDPLGEEERRGYLDAYLKELKQEYPSSSDGKVLFRYPRLFVVAVRK